MTCRTGSCPGCLPILLLLSGLSPGPLAADSRPAGWPPVAAGDVTRDGGVVQVTRTMTLDLPADPDSTFPLFGPVGESEWSPDWQPAFIAPAAPAQSPDGAVFTTGGAESPVVWVMTDYDPAQRIVRYVHLRPGRLVAQLWIVVSPAFEHASRAVVTYRYTLLGPEGREALNHFISAFSMLKPHWEQAIRVALDGRHGGIHPHH